MQRAAAIFVGVFLLASSGNAASVPTWDKVINSPTRFTVLSAFAGKAVRDKETGLVWMQDATLLTPTTSWALANQTCLILDLNHRRGWRLPTVEEISSLLDSSQLPIQLPAGHPFTALLQQVFWTSTTDYLNAANAHSVGLGGTLASDPKVAAPNARDIWCVRGGHGYDGH